MLVKNISVPAGQVGEVTNLLQQRDCKVKLLFTAKGNVTDLEIIFPEEAIPEKDEEIVNIIKNYRV